MTKPVSAPNKRPASPPSPSAPTTPTTPPTPAPAPLPGAEKAVVLAILLAKLEDSKTCDWFGLAQSLGGGGGGGGGAKDKGGKGKGQGRKVEGEGWSGNELRQMYQSTILPALRAGTALWTDDNDDVDLLDEEVDMMERKPKKRRAVKKGELSH
ncbi:hypothetical protein Q5752_002908 [Cryptotrichosporon argae]